MPYIFAGTIAVVSVVMGIIGAIANMMSSAAGQTSGVAPFVIGGLILAAIIAAAHWMRIPV